MSALGNLPTLINEYQASSLGMAGLDRMYGQSGLKGHVADKRRRRNGRALRAALSTYAVSVGMQALPGIAVAGAMGMYD